MALTSTVHFIVADHHWMVRASIAYLAGECREEAVAIEAADGVALYRALEDNRDVSFALIDETIVAEQEEAVFARVRKLAPKAAIGLLTMHGAREQALKAIYHGATAILMKNQDRGAFRDALALVLDGKVSIPRELLNHEPDGPETPGAPAGTYEDPLTRREREVMELIGEGFSVARIAVALKLSPHTVRVHVTRIMKKLDLRDRSSLIHHAVSRKLVVG